MNKPLAVGGVALAALLALAALTMSLVSQSPTARADETVSIEGLTGKSLGQKLGLQSVTWDDVKGDCQAFAEYDERNGFCLDSVVSDKTQAALLGLQINGYLLNDQQRLYVELSFQLNALMESGDASEQKIQELSDQLREMRATISRW